MNYTKHSNKAYYTCWQFFVMDLGFPLVCLRLLVFVGRLAMAFYCCMHTSQMLYKYGNIMEVGNSLEITWKWDESYNVICTHVCSRHNYTHVQI